VAPDVRGSNVDEGLAAIGREGGRHGLEAYLK